MSRIRPTGLAGLLALLLIAGLLMLGEEDAGREEPGGGGRAMAALVTRVIDGDTVEVELEGERDDVRYIGIDTPESVQPGAPVECFGPRSSTANRRLVEGRRVRLVFDTERRDTYGRLLAYVYVGRRQVNAILVRRGMARTLTIPPNDRFAPRLRRLERRAAIAGRGLWGACRP
jgi:micrococcal nuclease